MDCLLCFTKSALFLSNTYQCSHCGLVFKDPTLHLSTAEDVKRYSAHQNNENDQGYIDFLNKLAIPLASFLPKTFSALDYGAGPGPTLSLLLKKVGGSVENYDPIFSPDQNILNKTYDVVTSTEVVEHFKTPALDWSLMIDRLRPNGILGIMTQFYNAGIDYNSWWYKNDPTHVGFYQQKTLEYLADKFGLSILYNDKVSVVIFKKNEVF